MEIKVNGESRDIDPGTSIINLLEQLELEPRNLAIEHNGDILDETAITAIELKPGDRVEIVRFVGGG